ncbi:MAG: DUF2059 domain-containing protein [Acidobacteria bacterium]|nr:DUF2059 domain-containing protein [Acidobacteriota bacterium]
MLRDSLKKMLVGCALLLACVSAASAQEISQQKRAAIRKLLEVSETRESVATLFQAAVTEYQKSWPVSVITDFKAKGLFKSLTRQQAATMEKLIYEFSDEVFGEIKRRVTQELITPESMEELYAPAFDRHFSEAELEEISAFSQTPTGRKLISIYRNSLQEVLLSTLRAKGMFNVLSSPDAEIAKAERIGAELQLHPVETFRKIFSLANATSVGTFTEDEIREATAFAQSPLGRKVAELLPALATEAMIKNQQTYAPQVGKLTGEVIAEQMKVFERRTNEVFSKGGSRPTTKRAGGQ